MTATKYLLLILLTAALIFCSSDKTDESFKYKKKTKEISLSDIKAPESVEKILHVKEIKFGSLVDSENDITATPVLSDKEAVEEYIFRWFVNDGEVEGANEAVLSREYFREDDWVYCRVEIVDENSAFPEFVSRRVRVKGPLPMVNLDLVDEFTPPGVFRYKIKANMPEIEDFEPDYGEEEEIDPEKAIKFELISPLDKGIILDPLTGEITWDLTQVLLDELGDKITIKFSIISPSGRKVNSSIIINLKEVGKENNISDSNSILGTEIE